MANLSQEDTKLITRALRTHLSKFITDIVEEHFTPSTGEPHELEDLVFWILDRADEAIEPIISDIEHVLTFKLGVKKLK